VFERQQKEKLSRGTCFAKSERVTTAAVADFSLKECKAHNRGCQVRLKAQLTRCLVCTPSSILGWEDTEIQSIPTGT